MKYITLTLFFVILLATLVVAKPDLYVDRAWIEEDVGERVLEKLVVDLPFRVVMLIGNKGDVAVDEPFLVEIYVDDRLVGGRLFEFGVSSRGEQAIFDIKIEKAFDKSGTHTIAVVLDEDSEGVFYNRINEVNEKNNAFFFDVMVSGEASCRGDVNLDGERDPEDYKYMKDYINDYVLLEEKEFECADINADGLVNEEDLECLDYYLNNNLLMWEVCLNDEMVVPFVEYDNAKEDEELIYDREIIPSKEPITYEETKPLPPKPSADPLLESLNSLYLISLVIMVILAIVLLKLFYFDKRKPKSKRPTMSVELDELYREKEDIESMIKIAKVKYYKRKLDEQSYKEIVRDNQSKLISIESKIGKIEKRVKTLEELQKTTT